VALLYLGTHSRRNGDKLAASASPTMAPATGKKLYAVRDSKGRFKDIQTYRRVHSQDIKRKAKKEK